MIRILIFTLLLTMSLQAQEINLGDTYGKVVLIDEINCSQNPPDHDFSEDPSGASKVKTILNKKCRVMPMQKGESSYFTYKIGKGKKLKPGETYIIEIEYPEDEPRSMIICNTGNETIRGFHTGITVGDALHNRHNPQNCESLNVPLAKKWKTWRLLFRLHDRFPKYDQMPRGNKPRIIEPDDGFYVNIAQFSKKNDPVSKGIAVAYIRLYHVPHPEKLTLKINYPEGLPRRRIFWREEMADGVIGEGNNRNRGVNDFRDWYRYKAELMRFLGINTFTKDLLEFGANQGWDSTPYGGNQWVFYSSQLKHYWSEIVNIMGDYGFDVLPYYEYSGSKGRNGLGKQKRAWPLTRTNGYYTHMKWVEKANADITDPDTYEDFKKILDLTVVKEKDKARFVGIWMRPRAQMPISFSDKALSRFVADCKDVKSLTRIDLIKNKKLYDRYLDWWGGKRRDFLKAMRAYLVSKGIKDPIVLLTECASEPGAGFNTWEPFLVTDKTGIWQPILDEPTQKTAKKETIKAISPDHVSNNDLYLEALTSPGLNWGGYEINHVAGANDPHKYKDEEGVLLTHAFNRLYTVMSPKTFDAFRTKTGLVMIRHYGLNESMMHGKNMRHEKMGYFVADMERAGPFCMHAEAVAMANGDPTMIGYLSASNFGRGFSKYVRNFNSAFLSLPALPSIRNDGLSSNKNIAVRVIKTKDKRTYMSVVNTGLTDVKKAMIKLPVKGELYDAVTGKKVNVVNGKASLSFYPCQLKSFVIK